MGKRKCYVKFVMDKKTGKSEKPSTMSHVLWLEDTTSAGAEARLKAVYPRHNCYVTDLKVEKVA